MMASHVLIGSSSALAVPSLVTASGLSSVPGLLVSYVPGQVHTITHQLTQATIRQGVPSPSWGPGQLGCISPSSVVLLTLFEVQLLRVLRLGTAHDDGDTDHPCLPSPHPPPPPAPRCTAAQHWVRGPLCSTPCPAVPKNAVVEVAATEDSISITSLHQPALTGRTTTKPEGAMPRKPGIIPGLWWLCWLLQQQ